MYFKCLVKVFLQVAFFTHKTIHNKWAPYGIALATVLYIIGIGLALALIYKQTKYGQYTLNKNVEEPEEGVIKTLDDYEKSLSAKNKFKDAADSRMSLASLDTNEEFSYFDSVPFVSPMQEIGHMKRF